jgi:pyruvate/2-oxoglutarate dehydrogenase complex dihydrolipoamide acyltransferase (E2) component
MTMNPLILGETICHASLGEARDVAVTNKGVLERRQFMNVVLGGDHRVMDGASCARFLMTWKAYSENPTTAFLSMI